LNILWSITEHLSGPGTVVTVGTFDGFHLGHQKILERTIQHAVENGLRSLLLTFEPHPRLVVSTEGAERLKLLTTIDEKIEILEPSRLNYLVISNFTHAFAAISAEIFIREYLVGRFNMKAIVIGQNHTFGRNRQGNVKLLKSLADELEFQVIELQPLRIEEENISSTFIRCALNEGRIEQANRMLGRPYSMRGKVVEGHKKGRLLGFPTANLRSPSQYKLTPKSGIYATKVKVGVEIRESVTYIGDRPTFSGVEKTTEVHIHDFDQDLYDKEIEVYYYTFLREDAKFANTSELIDQINQDKKSSIKYFANGGNL